MKASDIDGSLDAIREKKLAHSVSRATGGKPAEVWVKGEGEDGSEAGGRINHPDGGDDLILVWGEDDEPKNPFKAKVKIEDLHHDDKAYGLASNPECHSWGGAINTEEATDEEAEAFYARLKAM